MKHHNNKERDSAFTTSSLSLSLSLLRYHYGKLTSTLSKRRTEGGGDSEGVRKGGRDRDGERGREIREPEREGQSNRKHESRRERRIRRVRGMEKEREERGRQ